MDAIRFHRLAAQEYRSAKGWYRNRNTSVASRFRDAGDSAITRIATTRIATTRIATTRIATTADSQPVFVDDIRWVRVRRFRYMLVFVRESSDSLLVLAVAHAKRRPGYWRRRR